MAVCSAVYLFSPVQLIPSFIPVVGLMDDALVLYRGPKLLYRITPPDVLKECQELVETSTMRKKEKIRSTAPSLEIAALWLLAAVASALMMAYVLHWRSFH